MSEEKLISDKALAVCKLISRGYSVQKACAELRWGTDDFYDEMRDKSELGLEYMRARECRADVRFERAETILEECKAGLYPSDVARVLMDGVKWMTGKEKAKVYGDSTILRGDKDNPLDIGLANLLDAAASRRALPAPDVIEGVIVKPKAEDFI